MPGDKPPAEAEGARRRYERDSVEFARVATFSDGMFAIAMTLLVVGIEVPAIPDTNSVSELWDEIADLEGSLISFFISFAVIGRYWLAHHEFFGQLKWLDTPQIGINLIYLCFIAFLPFPTGLLGNFFENPLAFTIYAVSVAVVSGMELVGFRRAHRKGLLLRPMPEDVYRWGAMLSFSPVVFFLASIPVAFVDSTLAVLVWLLMFPFQAIATRWKPEGADYYLGH
ncbi:MAG: DUF1211 domain-containing protein [Actinobacteria bacterium]|nr:DUF1211 domain-containing protein [Actinomycetota bacterium]